MWRSCQSGQDWFNGCRGISLEVVVRFYSGSCGVIFQGCPCISCGFTASTLVRILVAAQHVYFHVLTVTFLSLCFIAGVY